MIEYIESADDVLALTITGRIAGDELATVMERLEAAMDRHDKVHVFAETRALNGIDVADLPTYLKDALPMFGKLRHFGRVAIVADQSWVRVASKIESAVLPGITYRVFEPGQRDEALAWVQTGDEA